MCLANAFILAMAKVNGNPKYTSYRNGRGLKQPVKNLLSASGVKLISGGGFRELEQIQNYLSVYKIIVCNGVSSYRVIFSGYSLLNQKFYLLYDTGILKVVTNLKAAMANWYICNACDTLYNKHKSVTVSSLCTAKPPCFKAKLKYCGTCNRWFLSEKCFQNHLAIKVKLQASLSVE